MIFYRKVFLFETKVKFGKGVHWFAEFHIEHFFMSFHFKLEPVIR